MMRRYLVGLAILIGGVLGLFATSLLAQALVDLALGPGTSARSDTPVRLLALACAVVPPVLVARLLLPRGWTSEVGLFLVGWGCFWPVAFGYMAYLTVSARLSGGVVPSLDLASDPESVSVYLFFVVLPLIGLWLATAGLRQRRSNRIVSQG
jgi:hypothetical protein